MVYHKDLSTKERVKRLTSLIADAEVLEINPELIANWKTQLKACEDELAADKAKKEAFKNGNLH